MNFSHAPALYSQMTIPMLINSLVSTLINPNPSASDYFGNSVAISGNYAVVSASFEDTGATDAGQAYVFNVTTGALVSTLVNPNPSASDKFGNSVAISGNYAVVGAPLKDIGATDAGQAYVFNATTGALISTLVNPNLSASDQAGYSVAISGNYAVVGAVYEDPGSIVNAGQAYVFDVTTGALVSTLVNPAAVASDWVGYSVAISGNYAVVGAVGKDVGATDAGRTYVFDVTTGALVSTLVNPTPSTSDYFGNSVAISGNYAVVGAYLKNIGATDAGQAYVFDVTTGALVSTLVNPNPSTSDNFGLSVSISGNYAVVNSPNEDIGATDTGRTYVFDATTGALVSTLVNPNPTTGDNFGFSVAISNNYVVVGAVYEDLDATDAGRAYVFQLG